MKVLVTAGSTQVPIDKVRTISNIFKGNTGKSIAEYFYFDQGHEVTLLSSAPPEDYSFERPSPILNDLGIIHFLWKNFSTFEDLHQLMEKEIKNNKFDVIIHSAAIGDYKLNSVLDENFKVINNEAKVSSKHSKLYLELSPTIKLVDQIRNPWGFTGKLVKFKLQVGIPDTELISIAWQSMLDSKADFIVANCLEWAKERAYILALDGTCESVTRANLARALHERLA